MRVPVVIAFALLGLLLAGCDGSESKSPPPLQQGLPFADKFVHLFVVRGSWKLSRPYISPLVRKEFQNFQRDIVKDNVRRVLGRSVKGDCPVNPAFGAGDECIVYRLAGENVAPFSGVRTRIRSRFRVWLEYDSGRWQLISYDYDATVTHPGS